MNRTAQRLTHRRARDRACDLVRDLAHAHAVALADARARVRVRALDVALSRADAIVRGLDRDIALEVARADAIVRDLDRAAARARARARGRGRDRELADADLVDAIEAAGRRASMLMEDLSALTVNDLATGRPVRWLVGVAVRVLPLAERPRYAEEFRAELFDLSRSRRLLYAARLVGRSVPLRRSLRIPARRPARDG